MHSNTSSVSLGASVNVVVLILVGMVPLYFVLLAAYNIWFHPLRKYPGRWWMAASRLPYTAFVVQGSATLEIRRLHEKYGHVVRVNPDTLSFTSSQAWYDIYAQGRPTGQGNIPRDPHYYLEEQLPGFQSSRRLRKVQARALSTKIIGLHQHCIQENIALFIKRLSDGSAGIKVDLSRWITLLITDITGVIVLGEEFGGLSTGFLNSRMQNLGQSSKLYTWVRECHRYPFIIRIIGAYWRWEESTSRVGLEPDIKYLKASTYAENCVARTAMKENLDVHELDALITKLLIAGSDTTSTALAGAVYLLCKHPSVMDELKLTLRKAFKDSSDLTIQALKRQDYLTAVIQESLRLYPPVPDNLVRCTEKGGHVVKGHYIPPATRLTMNLWAANRSPLNFHRAEEMVPERWLTPCPKEFECDDKSVMKPFSVGPRDCVGKNLAWAEMRLVLANLVWHFDMSLAVENEDWIDAQKVFLFWEKPPLSVYLRKSAVYLNNIAF